MMPEKVKPLDVFDIRLALRVMRHISSGIYRDRAGALRELVSNSFDAQATEVEIRTNAPNFSEITVTDNGLGMDAATVRESFTHVGLSYKQLHPDKFLGGIERPVIGRFGIGLLAAAHISDEIWIDSFTPESGEGIRVHINLKPYFLYEQSVETFDKFEFGTVEIYSLKEKSRPQGTIIKLTNARSGRFYNVLKAEGRRLTPWPRAGKEPSGAKGMATLVQKLEAEGILYVDRLCGREQVLWQLSMAAPVEYLPEGPIRPGYGDREAIDQIRLLKKRTEALKFRVWMDGVELRKPILLPTANKGEEIPEDPDLPEKVQIRKVTISGKVEGKPVEAEGYLFYQPYRIKPADLRGLLPRLDYVGVGNNRENRFMASLTGENPVLRAQISGELFIIKGLHRALDLDRSGFMELDPEFMFLVREAGAEVNAFFASTKRLRSQDLRAYHRTKTRDRATRTARAIEELYSDSESKTRARVTEEIEPPRPDEGQKTIYSSPKGPFLEIDHRRNEVELVSTPLDQAIPVLLVGMDRILAKYIPDPTAARRELAKLVKRVLAKDLDELV